jgi:hypothetical protein
VLGQGEAVGSKYLAEDLGGNLEVSVVVKVLEEALGIKSVLADNFLELFDDLLHDSTLSLSWLSAAVVDQSASVIEFDVHGLFELLFGENIVDGVRKRFPEHVLTLLWRFEKFS